MASLFYAKDLLYSGAVHMVHAECADSAHLGIPSQKFVMPKYMYMVFPHPVLA